MKCAYLAVSILVIAHTIFAVVDFEKDYIALGDPGPWRKAHTLTREPGPETSSYTNSYYHYNSFIPTRLDSVNHYTSNESSSFGVDRYYYYQYPAYSETIIEHWYTYFASTELGLFSTVTIRYDSQEREIERISDLYGDLSRTQYIYDDAGNIITINIYKPNYSDIVPQYVTNYSYDGQNREIYYEYFSQGILNTSRYQTWSTYCLPDSIRIIEHDHAGKTYHYLNSFDENGNLALQRKLEQLNANLWKRIENHYSYVEYDSLWFPTFRTIIWGNVPTPYEPFDQPYTTNISYTYTNNYHSVSYVEGVQYRYGFDQNWLRIRKEIWDEGSVRLFVTDWEYYGSANPDETISPKIELTLYPNPIRGVATIQISNIPAKNKTPNVKVFNLKGQLVSTLVPKQLEQTSLICEWDGRSLPSGIYLLQVSTPQGVINKKMSLIR